MGDQMPRLVLGHGGRSILRADRVADGEDVEGRRGGEPDGSIAAPDEGPSLTPPVLGGGSAGRNGR